MLSVCLSGVLTLVQKLPTVSLSCSSPCITTSRPVHHWGRGSTIRNDENLFHDPIAVHPLVQMLVFAFFVVSLLWACRVDAYREAYMKPRVNRTVPVIATLHDLGIRYSSYICLNGSIKLSTPNETLTLSLASLSFIATVEQSSTGKFGVCIQCITHTVNATLYVSLDARKVNESLCYARETILRYPLIIHPCTHLHHSRECSASEVFSPGV